MSQTYNKLVIVQNPHSSAARRVSHDVFSRLDGEHIDYDTVESQASADDMADELSSHIEECDRIIVAGGDGTYNLAINALRHTGKNDLQLGFMPFGNRCDGAVVGGSRKNDVLAMASHAWEPSQYWPLHAKITTEEEKEEVTDTIALSYVTVGGPLARGASYFNDLATRDRIRGTKRGLRLLMSALCAADYIKRNFGSFESMPPGALLNGVPIPDGVSDIIALNGQTMATVLRNPDQSYRGGTFRQAELHNKSIAGVAVLAVAILRPNGLPALPVSRTELSFQQPGEVAAQFDGKTRDFHGVRSLVIDKKASPLRVLMDKS